jgi:hypothetical protein
MRFHRATDCGDTVSSGKSPANQVTAHLAPIAIYLSCLSAPAFAQADGKHALTDPESPAIDSRSHNGNETESEITVIGKRRGEADVASETEFDEAEVASQGAYDIQELLTRLQPFIDPTGAPPVLLINGRPAGFDRSILAYPPEALERVALLKPEAATHYGANPAQRVVNLVLKPKFASYEAGGTVNFATAGGQVGQDLNAARFAINGDIRWSAKVKAGHQSALRKSSRNIPVSSALFDSEGFVTGMDGGEIDSALSAAAGTIVNVAGLPQDLVAAPTLDEFAAKANRRAPVDPNAFETLQPSSRTVSVGLGVSYPIGSFSASLALDANRSTNTGTNGLPMVQLNLPSTSAWSPFDAAVNLYRPLAGLRVLRSRSSLESVSTSLTVDGRVLGFQTNIGLAFSRSSSGNLQETGVAADKLQELLETGDPGFNPFGPLVASDYLAGSRTRSSSSNVNVRLNLQRALVSLPTGALGWSFSATAGQANSSNTTRDILSGAATTSRAQNAQWSGQMSLNLPISRRESQFDLLGDLLLDATFGYAGGSRSSGQDTIGFGATWRPLSEIQISGSINRTSARATFDQTTSPIITTVNRIFDFKRQEIAEPIWITGGNPELDRRRSRQENLNMVVTATPFSRQDLNLSFGYHRSKATGGVTGFPELTPVVEAAFPERITRDGMGRLVAVDARPVGIEHNLSSDIDTTLTMRFGKQRVRHPGGSSSALVRDPLQFNLAVTHRYLLRDETLIRRGFPAIDRLKDNSGVSRQTVDVQFGVGERAFGSNLSVTWASPSQVHGEDTVFYIKPPMLFNLSAFVNPDRLFEGLSDVPFARKLKVSLNINNIFNGYRRVRLANSDAGPVYTRDEINPLGRTILLTMQKQL